MPQDHITIRRDPESRKRYEAALRGEHPTPPPLEEHMDSEAFDTLLDAFAAGMARILNQAIQDGSFHFEGEE